MNEIEQSINVITEVNHFDQLFPQCTFHEPILVMNVCCSQAGWEFADADDFHPDTNKQKMAQGIVLNDQVRQLKN